MMFHSSRPDLVVPIRDRRRGVRILTKRNFGFALAFALVFFVGYRIDARRQHASDDFGRLYTQRVETAQAPAVTPVADQVVSPFEAAAERESKQQKEQWSIQDPNGSSAAATGASALGATDFAPPPAPVVKGATGEQAAVAIVGGPGGVSIVDNSSRAPKLGGGFGR